VKRKLRKLLSILLVIALSFSLASPVAADGEPSISVGTGTGRAGDEISISVTLTNNPGIAGFNFSLAFDNTKLIPVTISQGAALTVGSITSNVNAPEIDLSTLNNITAGWSNALNFTNNGVIYTVVFRVKEDVAGGDTQLTLTYNEGDVSNQVPDDVDLAITNGKITVQKSAQTAPAAPTLAGKTATTVILNPISGAEYNAGGSIWQNSESFTNLTPNTGYMFYARLKETDANEASPASPALSVTTDKAALTGAVTITGGSVYGGTLTAVTDALGANPSADIGPLTYQWKRGAANIGTNHAAYTIGQADIGHTITVEVTAANCTGSVTSSPTGVIAKAAHAAPNAPTLESKTATSITLNVIAGAEYRRGDQIGAWQASPAFSDLSPNTSYTFIAWFPATATHEASPESPESASITTSKLAQNAPSSPTVAGKTAATVTLNAISGAEYRRGDQPGAWQTSPTFSGLSPNTAYTFIAWFPATNTHEASPESPALSVTTDKAALTGAVTITGSAVYGGTLTAVTDALVSNPSAALGLLTYQWKRGGTNIGTNRAAYTIGQDDIGHTITVEVTAANCAGSVTSDLTGVIAKAAQTAPTAPTLESKTEASITLTAIAGAEYRRGDQTGSWQTSPAFTGLSPNTSYTFYMRFAETATHEASPESLESASIQTLKLPQKAPDAPILAGKTATTVILSPISGAEYSTDGSAWQDDESFTNLTPDTVYTFYARLKETADHEASPPSPPLNVATKKVITETGAATLYIRAAETAVLDLWQALPSGVDPSRISAYTLAAITDGDSVIDGNPLIDDTQLSVTGAANKTNGMSATVSIAFTSDDYDIANAVVTVIWTVKTIVKINETLSLDKTYDGGVTTYYGAYTGIFSPTNPKNAGEYTLTLTQAENDENVFMPQIVRFVINPAALTVTALDVTQVRGAALPGTYPVQTEGFAEGEDWITPPEANCTATDGNTTGEYTIDPYGGLLRIPDNYTVAYVSGILRIVPRNNANLTSLSISGGTLSPVFVPTVTNYTADVANNVSSVTVTAVPEDPSAVVTGGTSAHTLNVGANPISVDVIAEDGITTKTYTVTVTRAAQITPPPSSPTYYTVSVTGGTGGGSYLAGATVFIHANSAAPGQQFAYWNATGAILDDIYAPSISFTMPNQAVMITAVFELAADPSEPVTTEPVTEPTTEPVTTEPVAEPTTEPVTTEPVTEPTTEPVTTEPVTEPTTEPVTTEPVTEPTTEPVTTEPAAPTTQPGGGGYRGGRVTSASSMSSTVSLANGQVLINYRQSGGSVILDMPDSKVNDIIEKTGDTLTLDLSGAANADLVRIPNTALNKLAAAGLATEIILPEGSVRLSSQAAQSAAIQAAANYIDFVIKPVSVASLNARQQMIVGSTPIYDISLLSNSQYITSFDGGVITIALPYTLKPGEKPAGAAVWRLDSNGNIQKMETMYDTRTQTIIFTTNHLSLYMVGYDAKAAENWINPFNDVKETDWFYGDVAYAHANGLFGGTSASAFSPNIPMSRAMLVTVIGRLAGANIGGYANTNGFSDVAAGQYYAPYVQWAQANAIVNGTGENVFAPNAPVARQDLAVILTNYARYAGKSLPAKQNYSEFADARNIAGSTQAAVEILNKAGIISGKPGNLFDPQGSATRAEAAAILRRFIETAR
jgi:hypothetical protein